MLKYEVWNSMTLEQKKEYKYRFGKPHNSEYDPNKDPVKCLRQHLILATILFSIIFLMMITAKSIGHVYLMRSVADLLDLFIYAFSIYLLAILFMQIFIPLVAVFKIRKWLRVQGLVRSKEVEQNGA